MSQRTKIIIIIAGAIIVFGLIIAAVFDLFPKKEAPAPIQTPAEEEVDLSFLEDDSLPENTVFDSSNKEEFAALRGLTADEAIEPIGLEKEARDLAEFFIERFETYSSDANGAQLDDLRPFMTASMEKWTQVYKENQPVRDSYYSVSTEAVASQTILFSLPKREAKFLIVTARIEQSGSNSEQYQQKATVSLEQNSQGAWKVSSIVWGDRL